MRNVNLGQPLSHGRTADVYAWEEGQVLKLFHDWVDLHDINYEREIGRAVYASGLPVPAVGEIIRVHGRHGLIYERVEGPSMWEAVQRKPWRFSRYARRLAALQARMHTQTLGPEIPAQRPRLEHKIRQAGALPDDLRSRVLAALETMPTGDRICHGDLHPGNVLLTTRGEMVIDWVDATRGNPLADVARTTIIFLGAAQSAEIPRPLMKFLVALFHATYIRHYFNLRPGGENEYRRWFPIVAAARLSEDIPELEAWLLTQVRKIQNV